ncbi:MAG: hypothetical protein WC382_02460 [Methanoregulaceae archaeon]|jgi:hypothetical protein
MSNEMIPGTRQDTMIPVVFCLVLVVLFHPQGLVRDTPRIRKLSGLNPDVICPIPMRLGMS